MCVRSRELAWLAAASLLLFLAASLPYLAAHRSETAELRFNGAVFDRQDHAVYLAMMHAGEAGDWIYRYRFSAEPQQGAYVRQYYLALGQFARLVPGSGYARLAAVFHAARAVSGLAMCAATYALFAVLFPAVRVRRLGFALAVVASGFGWLQLTIGWIPVPDISPVDFWLFDAYPFFSLLAFPHFTSVIALLAAMVALYLDDLRSPAWWKAAGIGLAGPLAVWIQPFAPLLADTAMAGAFLSAWWTARRDPPAKGRSFPARPFSILLLAGATQLPLVVFSFVQFRGDPGMAEFAAQNMTLSPPVSYYVLGFGPAGLAALFSVVMRQIDLTRPAHAAMLAWAAAAPVLAYLPWNYQRRFMLAYTIPLAALALPGLQWAWRRGRRRPWIEARRPLWTFLLVFAAGLSSLALVLGLSAHMASRPETSFDPAPVVRAADWLAGQAGPGEVALAERVETSRLLAARAGVVVYWGHPIETLQAGEKQEAAAAFFGGELPPGWPAENGIDWVLLEPGSDLELGGLEPAYSAEGVRIYRVDR